MENKNTNEDKYEKKVRGLHWLFGVVILMILLYLFIGELILPKENDAFEQKCRVLDVQWYEVKSYGAKIPIEVPCKCDGKRGEPTVLEARLPMDIDEKEYLCFRGSQQDIRVYIDGELRYEYSTKDIRPFGKNSPDAYVFVEVRNEDEGKPIQVRLVSESKYSGTVNTVYIGERMSIWKTFIRENGFEFVVAVFMIVLGIISIIVSIVLRTFYDKNIMVGYLGWGIVFAAVWVLSASKLRQLFFPNVTIIASMAYIAIMLVPLPFLIYMNSIQKNRYHRAYMVAIGAEMINLVVSVVLQWMSIRDFSDTIVAGQMIIVLSCILVLVTMVRDGLKGYIEEYRHVALGLGVLILACFVELIRTYAMRHVMAGVFVSIGLMFMLLMSCLKTGYDIVTKEREKQRRILAQATQVGFLAHMSHEIRTPLNTMIGMNEMILREDTSDVVWRYANNIKMAGKTLEALVSDILDFSKMQSGGFDMDSAPYYVASLINDSIHLLNASAEHKRLEVHYNIDETIPSILKGDEIRIKRVLNVLMENAVKHTEEGSVTLSIQGEESDDGRCVLKMSVADTGKGISKEDIYHIFHNFAALGKGENTHLKSTGLGLSMVKSFVKQMDGEIHVDSLVGKGSLFTIKIPQEVVNHEPIGDIHNEYRRECVSEKMVHERLYAPNTSLLVVDDSEMNLEVVKGMLKRSGIKIDTAISGQECLMFCKEKKYDLILMDHMMPDPDGVETLHRIRDDKENPNCETDIIVLTANAVSGIREMYLGEGFNDYLSKPVDVVKLERMLYTHLGEKASFLFEETVETREVNQPPLQQDVKTEEVSSVAEVVQESPAEDGKTMHINRPSGLSYCGDDEELYDTILCTYYEQKEAYRKSLAEAFEAKDWKNYAIKAHALKSTSLTIGAKEFSELAKRHEFAAKEANEELIAAEYELFVTSYGQILDEIRQMCDISETTDTAEDTKEEATTELVEPEAYMKMREQLLEHIQAYEMNEALELIACMDGKSVASEDEEQRRSCLAQIRDAVNDFEYDKAEEIITTWMETVRE